MRSVRMCPRRSASPRRRSAPRNPPASGRSEEHTSELQSHSDLVCRLLLEKKKKRHLSEPFRTSQLPSLTSSYHPPCHQTRKYTQTVLNPKRSSTRIQTSSTTTQSNLSNV